MKYYFDNAATTFPKPAEVTAAVNECMLNSAVNAGRGVYDLAMNVDGRIVQTRKKVKGLLGVTDGQVIFAPSATVALNQVILGQVWQAGDVVYTTPFEHNAVARTVQFLVDKYDVVWRVLPYNLKECQFYLHEIERHFFQEPPKVVIMSHVSNVVGVVAPIEQIGAIAQAYGAVIIIDGAQGGPLLPMNEETPIDFYVFSGHKTFYGPFGIAGFWTNLRVVLAPILLGGTGNHSESLVMPELLPYSMEIGSPNIVAIMGLEAACDWLEHTNTKEILQHEIKLAQQLIRGLEGITGVRIWVPADKAATGIVSFTIDGYTPQEVGMILNQQYGMAVRTGLHCAPLAHEMLKTIKSGGTVRVGLGWFNSEKDVESLLEAIVEICEN